jgi:hypothetical protein
MTSQRLVGFGWPHRLRLGLLSTRLPEFKRGGRLRRPPSAQGEIAITFDDAGTRATYPTGKSELEWRAYTRYKETEHGFLLFLSSYRLVFIPKRVMSPEQVRELRSLLSSHLRKLELP